MTRFEKQIYSWEELKGWLEKKDCNDFKIYKYRNEILLNFDYSECCEKCGRKLE